MRIVAGVTISILITIALSISRRAVERGTWDVRRGTPAARGDCPHGDAHRGDLLLGPRASDGRSLKTECDKMSHYSTTINIIGSLSSTKRGAQAVDVPQPLGVCRLSA